MIDLHFCPTPNCWKIAILLEETGLPYIVVPYNLYKGEQLTPEYRAINPNQKFPAIVDHDPPGGGAPLAVFESGAILIYLAEKSGRFLPTEPRRRIETLEWLIWQVAGLGPMFGQASHFLRYAPGAEDYSKERYRNEANRLARVLERRLEGNEYMAGDYSIADMALWPWVGGSHLVGVNLDQFPHIQRWLKTIGDRPAVQKVFANSQTAIDPKYLQVKPELTKEEWSNTFGENNINAAIRIQ